MSQHKCNTYSIRVKTAVGGDFVQLVDEMREMWVLLYPWRTLCSHVLCL